jgi:hypothetical protein
MIVQPITNELSDEQRIRLRCESKTRYQISLSKTYVVYAIEFVPGSITDPVLYRLISDFDAYLPMPACLFKIVEASASAYWKMSYNPKNSVAILQTQEFIDDPSLSEAVLDREPGALAVFSRIRSRLDREAVRILRP